MLNQVCLAQVSGWCQVRSPALQYLKSVQACRIHTSESFPELLVSTPTGKAVQLGLALFTLGIHPSTQAPFLGMHYS